MKRFVTILLFLTVAKVCFADILPTNLTCQYSINPLGVDLQHPALSWIDVTNKVAVRGQTQTAYEIIVSSDRSGLDQPSTALWSSGKILSNSTTEIPYTGKALATAERIFWKVRVWDQNNVVSPWSDVAEWTDGVMNSDDWKAQWISAPEYPSSPRSDSLLLRKTFSSTAPLKRALVYVCGLGQYQMTVNGANVTSNLLTPGWTKYDKTCLYDTYDVTRLVKTGENSVGLFLGNGPYNVHGGRYAKFTGSFGPQKAICQLVLQYQNGNSQVVGTDGTWKTLSGPITFSDMYGGEDYDARLLQPGWDLVSFNDHGWQNADVVSGPGGTLKGISCSAPPVVVTDVLNPVAINKLSDGTAVYDLGQNASVMPVFSVSGPSGSIVTITPAELVNPDGTVDRESVGGGSAYWKYTLSGSGVESYFPKFFYQGCRYLQVDLAAPQGSPLPVIHSLIGDVIGSSSKPVGSFSCSNDLFNKTYNLIHWAQRSNFMSIITDCPTRERLGWLEEDHLNGPSMRYNFDLDRLLNKMENDMADSQTSQGLIPDIAPEWPVFSDGFRDSPEWGSAFLLIPWQQYQFTGDAGPLKRNYASIKRYVDYLTSRASGHILNYGLGDWYDIGPNPPGYSQLTPPALTATAFYYQDALIVSEVAKMLGEDEDAMRYADLAAQIKLSFIGQFWNPTSGTFSTGSETANALPYVMGLTPDGSRDRVLTAIIADITSRKMSFTSGDIGYRYLLKALAEGGRSDVIYAMNNQSNRPGYGYQLKMGATSLTEAWDAQRSSSQNHFMLGQINEWYFHDLAGIQDDPAGPGFSKIIIKPVPVGDLTSAGASYDSAVGLITSNWELKLGKLTLTVQIPVNTTATIYVPTSDPNSVTEGGEVALNSQGVTFVSSGDGYAVYSVGSGLYSFSSAFHH